MTVKLPPPIAAYFAADANKDGHVVAHCFTDDAVVKDAIRDWKAQSSTTYRYTVEPFAIATEGARTVVTSHLEGDFPGSPLDLRYFFTLDGDKIAALEIIP